jgi:hypothetical protein
VGLGDELLAACEKHPFRTNHFYQGFVHAKSSLYLCSGPTSLVWVAHFTFRLIDRPGSLRLLEKRFRWQLEGCEVFLWATGAPRITPGGRSHLFTFPTGGIVRPAGHLVGRSRGLPHAAPLPRIVITLDLAIPRFDPAVWSGSARVVRQVSRVGPLLSLEGHLGFYHANNSVPVAVNFT